MDKLSSELNSFGLEIEGIPILDRQFHRIKYQGSKDKRGFYTGTIINDIIYCTYGTWDDRGNDQRYCSLGSSYESINDHVFQKIALERKMAQESGYKKASEKAQEIIAKSEFKSFHPYCERKKIKQPYCVMVDSENRLIIPIISPEAEYTSVQYISEDGEKKFLYGGRIKDCCHIIQGDNKTVYICEGWATGQSIHQATGSRVLVAFSEGNLENIVKVALEKYPQAEIVVCADNDHKKDKNVGLERGKKIKEKYNGISLKYPCNIEGTDFNDMLYEKGEEFLRDFLLDKPQICSIEDLCLEDSRSTCIPHELLQNKGLISLGLEAAKLWSGLEIIQYNFPVVLAHIATAIAGKIRYDNIHPSFFIIKIGTTSTGKSDSDKDFKNNIAPYFERIETVDGKEVKKNTFYGANDYSSGPAIFRSISKNLKSLSVMDEIKFFFESGKSFDPNAQGKKQAILELSTSAGQTYRKTYSDSGNDIVLEYPVINLIGNATESIFNAFSLDDMESGLIQRFDFFCYDGKTPYRLEKDKERADYIGSQFAEKIYSLRNIDYIGYYSRHDIKYDMTVLPAVNIGMTDDAEKIRNEYSHHIIDVVNEHDDGGKKGIINRAYQTAIKFALVHAGATRHHGDDFFKPLTKDDIEWGIAFADIIYKWKLNTFVKSLNSGDFDKMCEMFLAATKAAHRNKQKPTGNVLINKRPKLKNLTTRQWDEIVKVLVARKQIVVTPKSPTLYYPAK